VLFVTIIVLLLLLVVLAILSCTLLDDSRPDGIALTAALTLGVRARDASAPFPLLNDSWALPLLAGAPWSLRWMAQVAAWLGNDDPVRRHLLIDHVLLTLQPSPRTILTVGAGFDSRPCRLAPLRASFWIELEPAALIRRLKRQLLDPICLAAGAPPLLLRLADWHHPVLTRALQAPHRLRLPLPRPHLADSQLSSEFLSSSSSSSASSSSTTSSLLGRPASSAFASAPSPTWRRVDGGGQASREHDVVVIVEGVWIYLTDEQREALLSQIIHHVGQAHLLLVDLLSLSPLSGSAASLSSWFSRCLGARWHPSTAPPLALFQQHGYEVLASLDQWDGVPLSPGYAVSVLSYSSAPTS
jgi:hypothetical protein